MGSPSSGYQERNLRNPGEIPRVGSPSSGSQEIDILRDPRKRSQCGYETQSHPRVGSPSSWWWVVEYQENDVSHGR